MSFFARGRIAWILAMVLGIVLFIVGAVQGFQGFFVIAGVGFFLFGTVMLVISLATRGASD